MAKSKSKIDTAQMAEVQKARRRFQGGIAMKFVIPSAFVLTVMMSLLGFVLYRSAARALEDSVMKDGVFAASAAAAPDWGVAANRMRLKGMLTERVEDVIVWELKPSGNAEYVASATERPTLPIDPSSAGKVTIDATEITRGRIKSRVDGSWVPYRSFKKAIFSPTESSKILGYVEVILSDAAIESDLSSILTSIFLIAGAAIAVGVGVSFAVAGKVSRPLNALVKDMEVVAGGDLSHRTRAQSNDEVGLLAETFERMTRELEGGLQVKADLESAQHQAQITQEIQERLVPSDLPQIKNHSIHLVYDAAGDISADLFDVLALDADHTGILVMGAGGKGIPAAVVLAMARSTFRAIARSSVSPAEALKRMNALIAPDLRRGMYVTATYVIYDHSQKTARAAMAGQKLPILHFAAARNAVGKLHPGGIAIGLDKGPVFDRSIEEATLELAPGDTILFGTAGILEMRMSDQKPLGDARFMKVVMGALAGTPADPVLAVTEKINAHAAEGPRTVDLTLVALRRES